MKIDKGTIAIEGMRFHAYHGYYEKEREQGNEFIVDVYVTANLSAAAEKDDLEASINYETIYAIVEEIMKEKHKLLEHVCYRILKKLGERFDMLKLAKVRVTKLNPPIDGDIEKVFVELEKTFDD